MALGHRLTGSGPRSCRLDWRHRRDSKALLDHPDGIAFDGKGFVGTRVTAPAFSYSRPIEAGNEGLVDQTGIEPVTS